MKDRYIKFFEENEDSLKQKQLRTILKSNPVKDDYHTWIRTIKDIKTLQQAYDDDPITTPDYTENDIEKALKTGQIVVYSSYPIKVGVFITPSKMEAKNYAGSNKIYNKKVKITDIAWIDTIEGQYAI